MEFRIADTFTASLTRLTGDEQKAVKTTAFDLQLNPANPGMSFHKLDHAKDKNFWSVRVSGDIRIIVHRSSGNLLLCYVDHHDKAYDWAERRKLETHPKTGAAQLVEIRETVREIMIPQVVEQPKTTEPKKLLFAHLSGDDLLGFGVPPEWLADALRATDDTIFDLAEHLPAEAAEALLELAVGGSLQPPPVHIAVGPYEHPDAQRRFRIVGDVEELARALEYPWEKWTTFLHPAQLGLVQRRFGGPARVSGSAGTGKTIVALHRAAYLARANPDARVLLTTFSETLASWLQLKLAQLIGTEPRVRERIEVDPLDAVARRLYQRTFGESAIASAEIIRAVMAEASHENAEHKFSLQFLVTEWNEIVDAWQLTTWEGYRDVARLGRKTRLPEKQRQVLWGIFERARALLKSRGMITRADMYSRMTAHFASGAGAPYDFIVVDEAQDVSVPQLRFVAALGQGRPESLFFAGDLGQRIFQLPFSWKSLGVDIRGRSGTLRVNYRTSHQIRTQADRLLGPNVGDVDGNIEQRSGTISLFNGPLPTIRKLDTVADELREVGQWLADRTAEGVKAGEIGVFVRSTAELPRAQTAVEAAGLPFTVLAEDVKPSRDLVSIGTMHLSKGLEFRSVVVMACDDEVLPLQSRIETVADDSDLEEVYDTERHLLYVACTRARDHLVVTGVNPVSEFLDDLEG